MHKERPGHDCRWLTGTSLAVRTLIVGLMVSAAACSSKNEPADTQDRTDQPVRGFVLTDFGLVLPGGAPEDCPEGFNKSARELLVENLSAEKRVEYEKSPKEYLSQAVPAYYDDPDKDPCANPAEFDDPGMRIINQPLAIKRLEPDGSISERLLPPGSCPPGDDFYANVDQRPIDNQYWRVMGCVRGYQPGGLADSLFGEIQITEGNMTILIEVKGPADGENGPVEVGVYSSRDPVPLGTNNKPLPFSSLKVADESKFHNVVHGEISNGVLTTDTFDLRLIQSAARLDSELYLRDARLHLEIQADGKASGYIGGYWDIKWLAHAAIRIQDRTGLSSGNAAAEAHGYTCPGKYYAVKRLADGHPDPQTGDCTSISTLYSLEATPAFVQWP